MSSLATKNKDYYVLFLQMPAVRFVRLVVCFNGFNGKKQKQAKKKHTQSEKGIRMVCELCCFPPTLVTQVEGLHKGQLQVEKHPGGH